MAVVAMLHPSAVQADEGGSSVWLPGQFASFAGPGRPARACAASTVRGVPSGPGGRALSDSASDTTLGLSALYPMAPLKWQPGDCNFMVHSLASVPTGIYDPSPPQSGAASPSL